MITHAGNTKKSELRGAHAQQQKPANPTFQFADSRPETLRYKKLQAIANNSPQANRTGQMKAMADNYTARHPPGQPTIQLVAATAVGITHLVKKSGKSIMNGEETTLVESGDTLDLNTQSRTVSRRGPNQEMVGDYDKRGEHMYRWYKVNEHNNEPIESGDEYIRENTFRFSEAPELKNMRDLSPFDNQKRARQSHYAVRFEVWCNTSRNIDETGHMVMSDKSKEYGEKDSYYAYEMGKVSKPQSKEELGKMPRKLGNERLAEPELLTKKEDKSKIVGVEVNDARQGEEKNRIKGYFKTLGPFVDKDGLIPRKEPESEGQIKKRLTDQRRYDQHPEDDDERNKKYERDKPTQGAYVEHARFNKVKWIEILVRKKEYDYLMNMWTARKEGGFYCFVREARTFMGFELATRCLSSLEDIALQRNQDKLIEGHAEDILDHFTKLNGLTKKHTNKIEIETPKPVYHKV